MTSTYTSTLRNLLLWAALLVLATPFRAGAVESCSQPINLVDAKGVAHATAIAWIDPGSHELLIRVDALNGYQLLETRAEAGSIAPNIAEIFHLGKKGNPRVDEFRSFSTGEESTFLVHELSGPFDSHQEIFFTVQAKLRQPKGSTTRPRRRTVWSTGTQFNGDKGNWAAYARCELPPIVEATDDHYLWGIVYSYSHAEKNSPFVMPDPLDGLLGNDVGSGLTASLVGAAKVYATQAHFEAENGQDLGSFGQSLDLEPDGTFRIDRQLGSESIAFGAIVFEYEISDAYGNASRAIATVYLDPNLIDDLLTPGVLADQQAWVDSYDPMTKTFNLTSTQISIPPLQPVATTVHLPAQTVVTPISTPVTTVVLTLPTTTGSLTTVPIGTAMDLTVVSSFDSTIVPDFSPTPTRTFTCASATDTLTLDAHGFVTGQGPLVVSSSGGTLPAGLSASTSYWVVRTGEDTFKLATTFANAKAVPPIVVDETDNGTGTHTIGTQSAIVVYEFAPGMTGLARKRTFVVKLDRMIPVHAFFTLVNPSGTCPAQYPVLCPNSDPQYIYCASSSSDCG